MTIKNIAVIGPGGVGGYFGYHLNEASHIHGAQVSIVARGKTYERLITEGLSLVNKRNGIRTTVPYRVVREIRQLRDPDMVLICVKEYDLKDICIELKKVIRKDTIIMPIMNGVDIYDRVRTHIHDAPIFPTCVYITSHIEEPGVVLQKGDLAKLYFGSDPSGCEVDMQAVLNILDASGVDYRCSDKVYSEIWRKFLLIASSGLVSAKYNSSLGLSLSDENQRVETLGIMNEIFALATAQGIALPDGVIHRTIDIIANMTEDSPSSLQLDINGNKGKSELDLFAGAIESLGVKYNVPTPITSKIYSELRAR